MIDDLKQIILKHNNLDEGIYIPSNLDIYLQKIIKHAVVIPYYSKGSLEGFIAYYANNPNKSAFLTMILVDRFSQGQKIGKLLLESSINDLKNNGFLTYSLEVLKHNSKAMLFYQKYGFKIIEDRNNLWLMECDL
jgi:ribosomal protein S18 acetylase RimI-like enzyme